MSKTVMQSHLEWLKRRCLITPQVEAELLEAEKQQIMDAYNDGYGRFESGEQYYNLKFKDNDNTGRK